jgi:hypothetical protein
MALLVGCKGGKADGFDIGKVKDGVYKNSFFGFTVEFPKDWVVQSEESAERIQLQAEKMIAGDDQNWKAALDAADVKSAQLLLLSKSEMGAPVDENPNIVIGVENLEGLPGIKTAEDYLFHTRKSLKNSNITFNYLSEEAETENINGTEYSLLKTRLTYMGMDIQQTLYSTIIKRFSFNVTISYVSPEHREILLSIIDTMRFR